MAFKNMCRIITVLLIPICIFIFYAYRGKSGKNVRATDIFEIGDTQSVYYSPDHKVATLEKNYMSSKPPEEPYKLKKLVENYNKHIHINFENIKNEVRKARNEADTEINKIIVCINFYRESRGLPRSWKPNEAFFNTDRIEHHNDDCIASIYWSNLKPQKRYLIMKRSSDKDDYGQQTEIFEYIDDKQVEHLVFKK